MNINRRNFIQSLVASGALYGGLGHQAIAQSAGGFANINNNVLVNTFCDGGPDMRHLIVPRPVNNVNSYGYQYWSNRRTVHRTDNNFNSWMTRYNDAYVEMRVGGQGFGSAIDSGNLNNGVRFGILRQAGWLIEQFRAGNAAFVFNVSGVSTRAHDRGAVQLNQGVINARLDDNRSGWGGRLARSANANVVSVSVSPVVFGFGPRGGPRDFDPEVVDNRSLVSIADAREFGLNEFVQNNNSLNVGNRRLARALSQYYENLRNNTSRTDNAPFDRARSHEEMLRSFSARLTERLDSVNTPGVINRLSNNPNQGGLRSGSFARQTSNLFDTLSANDILNARVVSMTVGSLQFDTHANQLTRVERLFRDLFGGPYPGAQGQARGAFSALQEGLRIAGAQGTENIAYTFAGEFGRQLRGNGDNGTDHGNANMMMVIGDNVTGGLYGEMFPDREIPDYRANRGTQAIQVRTNTEFLFGRVCDWLEPNSAERVFPRLTNTGRNAPILESGVDLSNLIS